jgi:DNA-binding transcriptional LysR family regulator
MELRHLRHFLAVADALSYSRAAEALHMAASPLSRSIQQEASAIALPDREPFRALTAVGPEDLAGLRLLVTKGGELFGSEIQPYLDAAADVVTADNSIAGALAALIATSDSCCFTLANPEAPWHRDLAGAGVVIRPLPAAMPRAITHLAWRTDRAAPDDLGPIIALARERFASPLMC